MDKSLWSCTFLNLHRHTSSFHRTAQVLTLLSSFVTRFFLYQLDMFFVYLTFLTAFPRRKIVNWLLIRRYRSCISFRMKYKTERSKRFLLLCRYSNMRSTMSLLSYHILKQGIFWFAILWSIIDIFLTCVRLLHPQEMSAVKKTVILGSL